MSNLFKSPPAPQPLPPPPPPPPVTDADQTARNRADELRRRRGRAASVLAGNTGDRPTTATKTLLGA